MINGDKHEVLCCVKNMNVVESEQKRILAGVSKVVKLQVVDFEKN